MAGDRGLAMSLGATRWLFVPVLAPSRRPVPRPCGRPTPGSAGPSQRGSLPGLSCWLSHIRSPPCRRARHPVLRGRCCCCVCPRRPEDMEKKREEGSERGRKETQGRGHGQRDAERGGKEKKSYPEEGTRIKGWKRRVELSSLSLKVKVSAL